VLEFNVAGMSCNHCVAAVTRAVKSVDPQAEVDVDLEGHTVRVETAQGRDAVAAALEEAGYPPS
jgi:copper chaperone